MINKNIKIMKTKDLIQIGLNILAFLILFFSSGGNGSFWGFLTFNIIAAIVLIEILLSKDKTAIWVWITKTITYVFFSIKFAKNMGEIKTEYIVMIFISVVSLLISRHLIKRRAVALWGQNFAYIIGAYMYIIAILTHPETFGIAHILFWGINCISYFLLIYEIFKEKKDKTNLIIPGYAVVGCIVYMILIIVL